LAPVAPNKDSLVVLCVPGAVGGVHPVVQGGPWAGAEPPTGVATPPTWVMCSVCAAWWQSQPRKDWA